MPGESAAENPADSDTRAPLSLSANPGAAMTGGALPTNPAARAVAERLARQLRLPPEEIEVREVAHAEWPDTCLGLAADGEICGMMITAGYAVSLTAAGQRYEFRTDESGRRIRLASAPLVDPGRPLVTWRDVRSFSMLVIGTQRVAFGRRGRPLLVTPLAVPDRATELQALLARYAPFQARTPAGEVALAGVGALRATGNEERAVAEWASLVFAEADQGLAERAADRAIVWRRQGGRADLCDLVVIGRAGTATAYSCRGGREEEIARIDLGVEDFARLYPWLDRYEAFTWNSEEGGARPDAATITIDFQGDGAEVFPETEQEALNDFLNRVVRRLFTASVGR